MSLLLYMIVVAVLGLIILFTYQFFALRNGKIERLPNITSGEIIRPVLRFADHWFSVVRAKLEELSYPILMLFYRTLLRALHTLTSRIATRFNHLADTIKGKSVHPVGTGTVSPHWQQYRKLE